MLMLAKNIDQERQERERPVSRPENATPQSAASPPTSPAAANSRATCGPESPSAMGKRRRQQRAEEKQDQPAVGRLQNKPDQWNCDQRRAKQRLGPESRRQRHQRPHKVRAPRPPATGRGSRIRAVGITRASRVSPLVQIQRRGVASRMQSSGKGGTPSAPTATRRRR